MNANTMSLGELLNLKLTDTQLIGSYDEAGEVTVAVNNYFEATTGPEGIKNDMLYTTSLCQEMTHHRQSKSIGTTGYSALTLSQGDFKVLAEYLARDVVRHAKMSGAQAIVVRGTSGYSVAFAMRMLTDFPIIVARKAGESSLGCSISAMNDGNDMDISKYMILDDLVSSGRTVKGVMSDLDPAECVCIFEYLCTMRLVQESNWAELDRGLVIRQHVDYNRTRIPCFRHHG